uniref:Protein disulfide-isomerase n=1 Tax=Globodera rostochiensis TaxID=31243 RepID=A0A914H4U7_GLORO
MGANVRVVQTTSDANGGSANGGVETVLTTAATPSTAHSKEQLQQQSGQSSKKSSTHSHHQQVADGVATLAKFANFSLAKRFLQQKLAGGECKASADFVEGENTTETTNSMETIPFSPVAGQHFSVASVKADNRPWSNSVNGRIEGTESSDSGKQSAMTKRSSISYHFIFIDLLPKVPSLSPPLNGANGDIGNSAEGDEDLRNELEEEFPLEDGVFVLKDSTFDSFIAKNPTALVEFYAPWCGHCKQLAPEYAKAAAELAQTVPLAKVDAAVETQLAERFKVQGYPTIKLWKEGQTEPTDFDGERDAQGIVHWLKIRIDPNYKPPPEEVLTLTLETFDDFVGDKPIVLVEFYAPWCGHCKQLAPEYEKAAKRLKTHGIPLAKVDATEEKKLSEAYAVQGFPTLKIFRNGRRFDYNGPREAEGIVSYMLNQAKPAANRLNSVKEAHKFMSSSDVTIIGFFPSESGALYEAFVDAAERTRDDFLVGYALDSSIAQHFDTKIDGGRVILFQPEIFHSEYEPKRRIFPKATATGEELSLPSSSIGKSGQETVQKNSQVAVYYNVDFSLAYRDGTQYWRKKVLGIANKYKKQKYHFAVADEEEFSQELNSVGLGTSGLEQNVIVFGVDGKKYPMDPEKYDENLEDNLVSFLKDIGQGKMKPFVKSQSVPKDDKNGSPVRTLVAENFAKIVNDEANDVLIEFYAPWCGHCNSFEPKYKQFAAKHNREERNLIVAKFDATENDVPEKYAVEGFPTIYFAPSGKKDKPIKYSGNRDLEDLTKFVKKHAVASFGKKNEREEL